MHDHLSCAFKSGIITSPLFHSPKVCALLMHRWGWKNQDTVYS